MLQAIKTKYFFLCTIAVVVVFATTKSCESQTLSGAFATEFVSDDVSYMLRFGNKLRFIKGEYDVDTNYYYNLQSSRLYSCAYDMQDGSFDAQYLAMDTSQHVYFPLSQIEKVGNSFCTVFLSPAFSKSGQIVNAAVDVSLAIFDSNLQLQNLAPIPTLQDVQANSWLIWSASDSTMLISYSIPGGPSTVALQVVDLAGNLINFDTLQGFFLPKATHLYADRTRLILDAAGGATLLDSANNLIGTQQISPIGNNTIFGINTLKGLHNDKLVIQGLVDSANQINRLCIFTYDRYKALPVKLLLTESYTVADAPINSFLQDVAVDSQDNVYVGDCLIPCGVTTPNSLCKNSIRLRKIDTTGNVLWTRSFGGDASYVGQQIVVVDNKILLFAYRNSGLEKSKRIDVYYTVMDTLGNDITSTIPLGLPKMPMQIKSNKLLVTPNPCKGLLNVSNLDNVPFSYNIYDGSGRILHQGTSTGAIDVSSLKHGTYFLVVRVGMNKLSTKFDVY
jgi:hypothetical protein